MISTWYFEESRLIKMKILVFGASGGVGKQFIQQALQHGDTVTAFVRSPKKLDITHERLQIIQGDVFDEQAVQHVMSGHDVVVSCLGSNKGLEKSTELADMIKIIVSAMKSNHISRIVYTASAGIDKEIPGVAGKMMMLMLRNPLEDHRNAVRIIKTSGIDYTIARPLGLKDGELTEKYHEALIGVPDESNQIIRADVAHFLLKAVHDPSYINTSVGLCN